MTADRPCRWGARPRTGDLEEIPRCGIPASFDAHLPEVGVAMSICAGHVPEAQAAGWIITPAGTPAPTFVHVDSQRPDVILAGLVGPHGHLYRTSPSFHDAVDRLSQLLPLWIDAIATQAVKTDAEIDQRRRFTEQYQAQWLSEHDLEQMTASLGAAQHAALLRQSMTRPHRIGPHPFNSSGPQFERDCTECDASPEDPIHINEQLADGTVAEVRDASGEFRAAWDGRSHDNEVCYRRHRTGNDAFCSAICVCSCHRPRPKTNVHVPDTEPI